MNKSVQRSINGDFVQRLSPHGTHAADSNTSLGVLRHASCSSREKHMCGFQKSSSRVSPSHDRALARTPISTSSSKVGRPHTRKSTQNSHSRHTYTYRTRETALTYPVRSSCISILSLTIPYVCMYVSRRVSASSCILSSS